MTNPTSALIEALERIGDLDKFGGYNTACDIARDAITLYRSQQNDAELKCTGNPDTCARCDGCACYEATPSRGALKAAFMAGAHWRQKNEHRVFSNFSCENAANAYFATLPPEPPRAEIAHGLGKWMSAALDDPSVCAEMKADIQAWFDAGEPAPAREFTAGSAFDALDILRSEGWAVAVHNDYRVNGEHMTFWLFTHTNGRWIKGEAPSDEAALRAALASLRTDHEG
jgi:hypothetical protein